MSVTSDWSVARSLSKSKKPLDAKGVADLLKLDSPFQITARLKGMEQRELVCRQEGLWILTDKGRALGVGEEPAAPLKIVRIRVAGGSAIPLPDDERVPRIKSDSNWSIYYIWHRLPNGDFSRIDVWMDSGGVEYVAAHPMETADAVYVCHDASIRDKRLRKLENSSIKRLVTRHEKEQHERALAKINAKHKSPTTVN